LSGVVGDTVWVAWEIYRNGNWDIWGVAIKLIMGAVEPIEAGRLPTAYSLKQNYPNPFNSRTFIEFQVPVQTHVSLRIFDSLGREVRTLLHQLLSPGSYRLSWDGKDEAGRSIPSGVYLCRLETSQFVQTIKLICLK